MFRTFGVYRMKRMGETRRKLEAASREVMAEVCQLYGLPASLGAAYGVLFANPEPMTLGDVAAALGLAKSTTSTALRRLEQLRLVKRRPVPGSRSDVYEPITDPERIIRDWVERFILPELAMSDRMHDTLSEQLEAGIDDGSYDEEDAEVLGGRLAQLQGATQAARGLLQAYLQPPKDEKET